MGVERPTRRRVIESVCLLGLGGSAGCLRLTSPENQAATTGSTATEPPTDARTAEPEATDPPTERETEASSDEVEYPPGVSAEEVSDTLVLSHRQAVAEQSYTVETQYMFERRTTRSGDAGLLVTADRGPDVFVADGRMYQRFTAGSETFYDYRDEVLREYSRDALTGIGVLRGLIGGCDFAPVGTQTVDGETLVLIEADTVTDSRTLAGADSISRYFRESEFPLELGSASGVVTQDGIIRELSALLQGDGDSGESLVRTTDIGSTSLSTPEWTDTAREQEPQFEATLVDDGRYIRVEQVAGQSISVEMEIDAYDGRDYYQGQYAEPTSPGTTLFLYKTDDESEFGGQQLGIATGSRPSSSPSGTWSSESGWNLSVGPMRIVDTRDVM